MGGGRAQAWQGAGQGGRGGRAEPFACKKGAKHRRYRSGYDLLREEPEARVDMSGHEQEINALAREVVTDHEDFERGGAASPSASGRRDGTP